MDFVSQSQEYHLTAVPHRVRVKVWFILPQHTSNDLSLPQVSSFQSLQTTTALIIFPHLSSLLVTSTQHTSPNLSSLIFTTLHLAPNNFTLFLFQKPNLTPFYLMHLLSINPPYHIYPVPPSSQLQCVTVPTLPVLLYQTSSQPV